MPDFFDILFGPTSRPVRRDVRLHVRYDAEGNPIIKPISGQLFSVSDVECLDHAELESDQFYHCGCNAQNTMGGQCNEPGCANVSCATCFGRCASCRSALCLEHSRYLTDDKGQTIRLCRRCHGEAIRKRILRSVARGLLSPFVTLDAKETNE
jgi:hypothetical protein